MCRSEENQKLVLFFHHVSSKDQAQVGRLGSKAFTYWATSMSYSGLKFNFNKTEFSLFCFDIHVLLWTHSHRSYRHVYCKVLSFLVTNFQCALTFPPGVHYAELSHNWGLIWSETHNQLQQQSFFFQDFYRPILPTVFMNATESWAGIETNLQTK